MQLLVVHHRKGGEETDKRWWDAVDLIGIDANYPLRPDNPSPTVADLVAEWDNIIKKVEEFYCG